MNGDNKTHECSLGVYEKEMGRQIALTMTPKFSVAVFRCDAKNTGKKSENKFNKTVSN